MLSKESIIDKCIKLAKKGTGKVSPNPLVGCILIKYGKIIGEGFHKEAGSPHAEVNAINTAISKGFSVKGADLYVTLEPCSHYGKTPPCTDLIIKSGIKNVYIGMQDPNPLVNGKGIRKMQKAGIKVIKDIKEKECIELNNVFLKNIKKKLPYVSLKIAQSIDGKIALNNFSSKWITGTKAREFVQQLRFKNDAVLVGSNTVKKDNPKLTYRGKRKKVINRIVLTSKTSKISEKNAILSDKYSLNTFLISSEISKSGYRKILSELYKMGITSVLVEGGAFVFSKFLEYDLFDDIYILMAPKVIGKGISSFANFEITNLDKSKNLRFIYSKKIGDDILLYYKKLK